MIDAIFFIAWAGWVLLLLWHLALGALRSRGRCLRKYEPRREPPARLPLRVARRLL